MKIVSVVGARPEFVQAMPVSRALRVRHHEVLVHTGQHYDYRMSQAFFDELSIPAPDHNLDVGSGPSGQKTGEMLGRIEAVLVAEKPDLVVVRGDTNSTLAAALSAAQLAIPSVHIESGERSYDRRMPEEVNRLVADRLADRHYCASASAVVRLAAEGISDSALFVGDPMLDALLESLPIARRRSNILARLALSPRRYALATIHRAANTDEPARLARLLEALDRAPETVVFPCHPRTKKAIEKLGAHLGAHVRLVEPVGYLDMLALEDGARLVATDSGGVQREAYALGIPCLTLREETEWGETVAAGWNRLVGADVSAIVSAWSSSWPSSERPPIFGDGTASARIARDLDERPVRFGGRRR